MSSSPVDVIDENGEDSGFYYSITINNDGSVTKQAATVNDFNRPTWQTRPLVQ